MSKKRLVNLVEFLVHIVVLVLMMTIDYVSIKFNEYDWPNQYIEPGNYTYFEYADIVGQFIMHIFTVMVAISGIICLISAISKNEKKDGIIHTVVAIINFLIGGFLCWSTGVDIRGYYTTPTQPFTYVIPVLFGVIILLSFIKRSNYISPTKKQSVEADINNLNDINSSADELKKYRDLLDNGVITQEEFDAKKKQLLGL